LTDELDVQAGTERKTAPVVKAVGIAIGRFQILPQLIWTVPHHCLTWYCVLVVYPGEELIILGWVGEFQLRWGEYKAPPGMHQAINMRTHRIHDGMDGFGFGFVRMH